MKPQTSNAAVYGELGRFPLATICIERSLKYWTKLHNNQNSLMTRIFNEQCALNISNYKKSWAKAVKSKFEQLGLGNIHNYSNILNINLIIIRQRLRDQYLQEWHQTLMNQSKMNYFNMFKTEFKFENYLDIISNENLRIEMSRFRLASHH